MLTGSRTISAYGRGEVISSRFNLKNDEAMDAYYKAEYNDGTKTYNMRGRIAIVAQGKTLYQVRITTPQSWYSYYENVFRKVRNSFKFE